MSAPLPFGKFFWSDYASDPALKVCGFAAQGLWMRMLCIAAEHSPVGYVAINGRCLDPQAIARVCGGSLDEVSELLSELESNGVFSRDRRGWIYSRRMLRDAKKARNARENGKKGGNPKLRKQTENPEPDNPSDKGRDKPHIPYSRNQSPEVSTSEVENNPKSPADAADAASSSYAFFGQTIKLAPRHFNEWKRLFHTILDIAAELSVIDGWWQTQSEEKRANWFIATKGMLNKKHQQNLAIEKQAQAPPIWDGMP
jgi:hypothetical protein